MLRLKGISKTYKTGDLIQQALDDVSLNLRDNEFVAILGPSGTGKTTLLNIIGGLDRYDEGDLIINNVSTKNYKDRDWDTYRNHTIGFVFQSYNLIPHQSILSNVELALTIGGIGRKERKNRALKALEEVGLAEQAHKKPNQMSGGQMQRVAIARALVNNPDILLADEPTGALDSKTSIQVMELLKAVARDRLVVMVTHNPELADTYANRIVRLRDGHIISDSNPFEPEETPLDKKTGSSRKAHMSYLTALSLSFNNLLTKKGRTILTAFAGSIGIIGIALILSLSTGFQNYIDKIQEDTLSSYPLTITSETADATSAILSMVSDRQNNKTEGDVVRERQYLTTMFSSIGTNDLKSFKHYLDTHEEEYENDISYINYAYSIKPLIYTIDSAGNLAKLNPNSLWSMMYSSSAISFMSAMPMSNNSIFSEMNDNTASYIDQYDVLAGRWPERFDEMILVLSEPNSVSDLLLYSLGLRDTAELKTIVNNVMAGKEAGVDNEPLEFTYEDLMNVKLRLIRPTDTYRYNVKYGIYEDMSEDEEYMRNMYDRSLKLKIVGIVCLKEGNDSMALSTGVNYTKALTNHIIEQSQNTAIVQKQLRDTDVDVFSGKRFDEENKKKDQLDFDDMITVDEDAIKDAFKINISEDDLKFDMPSEDRIQKIVMEAAQKGADSIINGPDRTQLITVFTLLNSSMLNSYISQYEALPDIIREERIPPQEEGGEETVSRYLILDDEKISQIRNGITAETYQNNLNRVLNDLPDAAGIPAEMKEMLKYMFDADDYAALAGDVKKMYDGYFTALKGIMGYDAETKMIPYDDSDPNNIRYGTGGLMTRNILLATIITDEDSLSGTNAVINKFMNQYVVGMIAAQIGMATAEIVTPMAESMASLGDLFSGDFMKVDTDAFAKAFKFNMDQDELSRIMQTMINGSDEKSYSQNLITLGYQDIEDPSSISFYFRDFDAKENFLSFLDRYNENVDEDTQIRYTDVTGILMSSVKTIVDVVTYVLIAFVSISLVVSSIMIAVITLISVMERTKEIGILRAMGASKRNISSIFSAETFIIGLFAGLLGVGLTFASLPLINHIIHTTTNNYNVNAVLPGIGAIALVIISVVLTIFAGFIPSKKAAKQDPVIALRTE